MRARKKGVVGLVIAIALMMVLLAGMLYFSYAGDSYNVDNALTGAAIGLEVENNLTKSTNSREIIIDPISGGNVLGPDLENDPVIILPITNETSNNPLPLNDTIIVLPIVNETNNPDNNLNQSPVLDSNYTIVVPPEPADNQTNEANETAPPTEDLPRIVINATPDFPQLAVNNTNKTVPHLNQTNHTLPNLQLPRNITFNNTNQTIYGPKYVNITDIELFNFGDEDVVRWNKTFNANDGNDRALAAAFDSQDNIFVAGQGNNLVRSDSGNDWWMKKFYGQNGSEDTSQWNKTFASSSTGSENPAAIAIDSNDLIYIAGYGRNIIAAASNNDWLIKRFNRSGYENVTEGGVAGWNLTFDGATNQNADARGVAIDSQNNVYVVGSATHLFTVASGGDFVIKKFYGINSSEDTSQWNKTYSSPDAVSPEGNEAARAVAIDSSDLIYVAGDYNGVGNWWIKRFNRSGYENVTDGGVAGWNFTVDGTGGSPLGVAVDSQNNVYVAGYGNNLVAADSDSDWWVKKYFGINGSEDTSQWNKTFDYNRSDDAINTLAIDSQDTIYLAGYATSTSQDWWIRVFNRTGTENLTAWNKTVDGSGAGIDQALGIAIDSRANVTIVGVATGMISPTSSQDWLIKKYEGNVSFSSGGGGDTTVPAVTWVTLTQRNYTSLSYNVSFNATINEANIDTVRFSFNNFSGTP